MSQGHSSAQDAGSTRGGTNSSASALRAPALRHPGLGLLAPRTERTNSWVFKPA